MPPQLLVSLVCVALAVPAVAGADGAQQEDVPFSGVLFNPCNAEQVATEGVFHNLTRVDTDESGGIHILGHQNAHLSGVGLTTGAQYSLNTVVEQITYNQPETTTQTTNVPFRFVAQGSIPNFTAVFRFHLTINHNGVLTSDVEVVSEECPGGAAP